MSDYVTKDLTVKKFGWKRIAKNTQRFGWILDDAVEQTTTTETTTYEATVSNDTIYVNPRTNRTSKVRVFLSFYRYNNTISSKVKMLEFFYNIIFFLRRVLAFLLPIATVCLVIVAAMGGSNSIDGGEFLTTVEMWWGMMTVFWLGFIIIENIFARIAYSMLKKSGYFD